MLRANVASLRTVPVLFEKGLMLPIAGLIYQRFPNGGVKEEEKWQQLIFLLTLRYVARVRNHSDSSGRMFHGMLEIWKRKLVL